MATKLSDQVTNVYSIFGFGADTAALDQKLTNIQNTLTEVLLELKALNVGQGTIIQQEQSMKLDFSDLQSQVARLDDVQESVVTLINGLSARIDQMANDAEDVTQVQAVLAETAQHLRAKSDALAEAVVQNTEKEH